MKQITAFLLSVFDRLRQDFLKTHPEYDGIIVNVACSYKPGEDTGADMNNIDDIIEVLTKRMIDAAERMGSLTHPDVVAISQRLDRFLVLAQRAGMANTERYIRTVRYPLEARDKYTDLFGTSGNRVVTTYTKKHKASPR